MSGQINVWLWNQKWKDFNYISDNLKKYLQKNLNN
jgi:hypothetical protein